MKRLLLLFSIPAVACAPADVTPGGGGTASSVASSAQDSGADGGLDDGSGETGSSGETSGSGDTTGADATASGGGSAGDSGGSDVPRWQLLIQSDPYPHLVIEVDYVTGRAPRPTSIDQLETIFSELLDKPGGVEVVLDEELPESAPDKVWTPQDRYDLADATDNLAVADDTIKLHALFVDGHASEDDTDPGVLLGWEWGWKNMVLFRDTLDSGCQAAAPLLEPLCADSEFLVWQHEIGHSLGLVDNGLPMLEDHLDHEQGAGKHDANHDCVMYRSLETLDAVNATLDRLLAGAPPIEFDAQCLADVQAVIDAR